MNSLVNQKGFTLIEVLVAMVILTIGILSLYMMQISAIKTNSHASHLTTAATWNTDQIEQFVGMSIDKDELKDTDNDLIAGIADSGCCQNGNDPAGNNVPGCADMADGCALRDGYFVYWNVALNAPMAGTRTVQVIVRDSSSILSTPVVFQYIKNENI
jgi:type IV pilus modification protein PilV